MTLIVISIIIIIIFLYSLSCFKILVGTILCCCYINLYYYYMTFFNCGGIKSTGLDQIVDVIRAILGLTKSPTIIVR